MVEPIQKTPTRRPDQHKCPHPLCNRNVSRGFLACRAHWSQVPRPLREAIYATVGTDRQAYAGHVAEVEEIWVAKAEAKLAKAGAAPADRK